MARTKRNRHAVPHGWEVRDGGRVHCTLCPDTPGSPFWPWCPVHGQARPHRRSFRRCEVGLVRKLHRRAYRARVAHLMRLGRYDEIPAPRGTGGWISW